MIFILTFIIVRDILLMITFVIFQGTMYCVCSPPFILIMIMCYTTVCV